MTTRRRPGGCCCGSSDGDTTVSNPLCPCATMPLSFTGNRTNAAGVTDNSGTSLPMTLTYTDGAWSPPLPRTGLYFAFTCEKQAGSPAKIRTTTYFGQQDGTVSVVGTAAWPVGTTIVDGGKIVVTCNPFSFSQTDTQPGSPTFGYTTTWS